MGYLGYDNLACIGKLNLSHMIDDETMQNILKVLSEAGFIVFKESLETKHDYFVAKEDYHLVIAREME